MSSNDNNIESAWFSKQSNLNIIEHFNEIKTYAYLAFDNLDEDKNGYIDQQELLRALDSPHTSEREKSFILFLLNNQEAISESHDDGPSNVPEGISRQDLEAYFKLISQLLS